MARTTFDIPDALSNRIASEARKRGLNISTIVEEALLLWEKATPEAIGLMAGPLKDLPAKDRKIVTNFCEILRHGSPDLRKCVVSRVRKFLVIVREESGPQSTGVGNR
jgi:hypothetical protein